jgi:hypothetical protein
MFPQGGPGFGLVLLRIAAVGMFALNVTHRFDFSTNVHWLVISLVGLISLGLLLGFLTPLLAIVTCIAALPNLFFANNTIDVVYIIRILTSAALFFLVQAHIQSMQSCSDSRSPSFLHAKTKNRRL